MYHHLIHPFSSSCIYSCIPFPSYIYPCKSSIFPCDHIYFVNQQLSKPPSMRPPLFISTPMANSRIFILTDARCCILVMFKYKHDKYSNSKQKSWTLPIGLPWFFIAIFIFSSYSPFESSRSGQHFLLKIKLNPTPHPKTPQKSKSGNFFTFHQPRSTPQR